MDQGISITNLRVSIRSFLRCLFSPAAVSVISAAMLRSAHSSHSASITLINVDPVLLLLPSDRYAKKAAAVFDSGDGGGIGVPKETIPPIYMAL